MEKNIQELWNNYSVYNICVMGILEGKDTEAIFDAIMVENFPRVI